MRRVREIKRSCYASCSGEKLPDAVIKKSTLALGTKRNYMSEILIKLLLLLGKNAYNKYENVTLVNH